MGLQWLRSGQVSKNSGLLNFAGLSILVSSVLSAVLMEMRYYNKRATAEFEAQLSSDEASSSGMEVKKEK